MKNTLIAILALGLILGVINHSNEAKANPHVPPGAVVFTAEILYQNGQGVGFVIDTISQGKGTQFKPGMDLAPSLELLINQGFEIQVYPGQLYVALRR